MAARSDTLSESTLDLVERAKSGDEDAATRLYEMYTNRLVGILQSQISARFQSRFDADDVLISVWRTLFRGIQEANRFSFDQDEDFWKLLVTIALTKLRKSIERASAIKRSPRSEQRLGEQIIPVIARDPSPEEQYEVGALIERIVSRLDDKSAMILMMRLDGHQQKEIAEQLCLNERTIRRKMDDIRAVTEQLRDQDDCGAGDRLTE